MERVRWAIVGTGYIAGEFAKGMQLVEDAEIAAVIQRFSLCLYHGST